MFKKILKFVSGHKIITILAVLIITVGGYFGYKSSKNNGAGTRYVLAAVEKGTIITSVSGSGQVSASDQADIKSEVNSEVEAVYVKIGDNVSKGKLLFKLDETDFQKALNDAQTSLDTANLELEELLSPPDELSLLQAEDALNQAKESKTTAEENLTQAYQDGFNAVSNVFLDLPSVMSGLHDVLFSYNFSAVQQNINFYSDAAKQYDMKAIQYGTDAFDKYQIAKAAYDKNFQNYKDASRFSSTSTINSLLEETYNTVINVSEAIKSANNLIQFYQDELLTHNLQPQTLSSTHLSSLASFTSKTNSEISSVSSAKKSISSYEKAIVNAENTIRQKELSLENLKAGADELAIRAKKISVQQKEDALLDAQQNLNSCYIKAPFDGVIAAVNVKKRDSVSANTAIAKIITKQRIAEISLNEVDAAKVKVGQKATLTFDAIDDLTITGEVIEVDALGTITQGVVTYSAKIGFDTQEEKVKPGMSVSASIIIETKQNVLLISNSAIKSQGDNYYVETLEGVTTSNQLLANTANSAGLLSKTPPQQQSVEIGLSNDSYTEIISGLKEGDQVVTQTITKSTSQTQKQQNSSLRIPGISSGGGGFPR